MQYFKDLLQNLKVIGSLLDLDSDELLHASTFTFNFKVKVVVRAYIKANGKLFTSTSDVLGPELRLKLYTC